MQALTEQEAKACEGLVIRESRPFVQLITAPVYYEEETVVGITKGEWRAVANVDGALCVIAVTLKGRVSE